MFDNFLETLKKYLHSLTYGLFYPAFFGNMVYDLILQKRSSSLPISEFDIFTCWLILILFVLDFLHLHGELKSDENKQQTVIYMVCDILTSLFFFLIFVYVKEENYKIGYLLLASIPVIMLAYNIEKMIYEPKKHSKYIVGFYIIFIVVNLIILCLNQSNEDKCILRNLAVFGTVFYALYVFIFYHLIKNQNDTITR